MELDLLDVILGCLNMSAGLGAGINIGSFEKTIKRLSKNPFNYDQYEKSIKNKKANGPMEFLDYYVGMPGRFLVYRIFDNPNNWE